MILSEDINKNLSKYENKIYSFVKNNSDDFDELKESIMNELNIFYELSDKTDNLSLAKKKYLNDYIHSVKHEKIKNTLL